MSAEIERGSWVIRRDLEELGSDLRSARLAAGLTLRDVARAIGVAQSTVLATERPELPGPRPELLARHAAAVGMRVRIKAYPEGEPLRDAAQLELARRFRERIKVAHQFALEVPVSNEPGDQRAWDATLTFPGWVCALEFVTRFHDCQAQLRAFQLKLRDGNVERLVVVIRATHANRRALSGAQDLVASAFPIDTRRVMHALAAGRDPGANGVVLL